MTAEEKAMQRNKTNLELSAKLKERRRILVIIENMEIYWSTRDAQTMGALSDLRRLVEEK